jgi:hypothetical protein
LAGDVPTGAYITADLAPEKHLILLVSNTEIPGQRRSGDLLYPGCATYAYRIDEQGIGRPVQPQAQKAVPKRSVGSEGRGANSDPERQKSQAERLGKLPVNKWVFLADPGRVAPLRTWGSATFDSDRGQILIWGGGHCGYGGSDVDEYDVAHHTWVSSAPAPEYPHRMWARGVRLAGVTFGGNPWTEHGRRVFAYDPTSRRMISVRTILLTTGYEPEALRGFPGAPRTAADTKVKPGTAYNKYVTWSFDPDSGHWDIVGPAPAGLDTLVGTPRGVFGVNADWPTRLNDAGYILPWSPDQPEKDNAVFQFDAAGKQWKRLGERQPSPQNLYEQTSLALDTRRDQLLLHGAGKNRDELWAFDLKTNRWRKLEPKVASPTGGGTPPAGNREAVYLPAQDIFLTYGPGPSRRAEPALWSYGVAENAWHQIAVEPPPGTEPRVAAGQNRALVYDAARDLVLLVVGANDRGEARVYAMRYRQNQAP